MSINEDEKALLESPLTPGEIRLRAMSLSFQLKIAEMKDLIAEKDELIARYEEIVGYSLVDLPEEQIDDVDLMKKLIASSSYSPKVKEILLMRLVQRIQNTIGRGK